MQMVAVVVGWQVYEISGNPLDLGLIGLAEFLPVPLLVLLAPATPPTGSSAGGSSRSATGARALVALALLKITFDGADGGLAVLSAGAGAWA